MLNFEKYLQLHLNALKVKNLHRSLTSQINDQKPDTPSISFNDNDYLNLSKHPAVIRAIIEAAEQEGMGIRSSRLVNGNNSYYTAIETLLSSCKQTEAALLFGSGYLTHIGMLPALAKAGDLIIADKFIHASMIDGARLSGAKFVRFAHNNADACLSLLQRYRSQHRHCFILTETVFSMDGDLAPLPTLFKLANEYNACLISDDAHGFGLDFGNKTFPAHIHMGTLSKAIGCYGGYVCASHSVIEYLINTARSLIYSTALPTPILAGIYAALTFLMQNKRISKEPIENAKYFTNLMSIPPAQSAIVPYPLQTNAKTLEVAQALKEKGLIVSAIRPPTVPVNSARLRLTFSASHRREDIQYLAYTLQNIDHATCL